MNILLAAAEIAPFAKSGGLADAVMSLALGLNSLGHKVVCIMPKHGVIDTEDYKLEPTFLTLNIPMGYHTEYAHLLRYSDHESGLEVYFVEHDLYFNRNGIYGDGNEYFDNDKRFIFFSRSIFEACKALDFTPDIIHAHDNHTAFAMPFLSKVYRLEDRFKSTAGVYTIHNLAYQGIYDPYRAMDYSGFGIKEFYDGSYFRSGDNVNSMKTGIMFADKVTTVSPAYSREIRMHYYAEGLHDELNSRSSDLVGILNGVDYAQWSPKNDKLIPKNYSIDNIEVKNDIKKSFIENGMFSNPDLPLVGMVTRLPEQKGIDLVMNKLEGFLQNGSFNFAILGSGANRFVEFFKYIKYKFPESTIVEIGYNERIAHRIFAASDYMLIPSRFEPCGLTQMYALSYGTIPIVRNTGGLSDTVFEYQVSTREGNGFVFNTYNAEDFANAINRALSIYNSDHWHNIRENGMRANHSYRTSAEKYTEVYNWAKEKL
ncbi:MAG: glycogen synthase GlgA [Candidatus Kapaibacteriales bacterium]